MKSTNIIAFALLGLLLISSQVYGSGCDGEKDPDDSDVTQFFKNIGCRVKQGTEAAKPYAEKIGQSAKDLGNTVAQKYDEWKHRLTDDTSSSSSPLPSAVPYDAPTERVPLAPLAGDQLAAGPAGTQPAIPVAHALPTVA